MTRYVMPYVETIRRASVGRPRVRAVKVPNITPAGEMALALKVTGKAFYEGTVPAHVKARRRAAGKRARKARRANR